MTKFTLEEKLAAVREYKNSDESFRSLGKKLGINWRLICKWMKQYEVNGREGLIPSYTKYPLEFKIKVINYMNDTGLSMQETAAIFKIASGVSISDWQKTIKEKGISGLDKEKKNSIMNKKKKNLQIEKDPQTSVSQEIEQLRMENAYLKKLNALIQEKEKLAKKTK